MDIHTLRETPHLSATAISDYIDCGLMYRFGRIDRLPKEFTPDALLFGAAIHQTLGEYFLEKMSGVIMTAEELIASFEKHWKKVLSGTGIIRWSNGNDEDRALLQGKELLQTYYHKLPDENITILGIEESFILPIDGVPVPIIGVIDLILEDSSGVITIVDYKTSAKSYSIADVDKNFQLSLYHLAAKSMGYLNREILLRFDVLIKTKQPKFEQYYTTRSETDEIRVIRKIQQVWDGIDKSVFIPNDTSWKCSGCMFQNACKEWFSRIEEYDIAEEAI